MAFMAGALPYISAAATIGQSIGQANAEEQIANIQAAQLEKQSIADTASAVQQSKQERRRAELLQSRVRALAGKSGTSVSSPDILNTMADIDEQGEYNALAALHSGYSSASSKRFAAQTARGKGKQARKTGKLAAASTILDTIETRYG